jgi:hypothetical protein
MTEAGAAWANCETENAAVASKTSLRFFMSILGVGVMSLNDALAGDVSCPQWTDNGEAGVWQRASPLRLFCAK